MTLSNKWYDTLKWVALVALPALAVAVGAFGPLLDWDGSTKFAGAIVIVDTLLGALLQKSSSNYGGDPVELAGHIRQTGVDPDTGIPDFGLVVTRHPDEILKGDHAVFKIDPPATPEH